MLSCTQAIHIHVYVLLDSLQNYKKNIKKCYRKGTLRQTFVFLRLKGIKAVVSFDEYAC